MRKLSYVIVIAALSLISTTAFAQEVEETVEATEVAEVTEATEVEAVAEAVPQEKVEIQLSELPEAVTATLAADFAGYTADKAFKTATDGAETFTVQLSKEGEAIEVNFDAEGKVIE